MSSAYLPDDVVRNIVLFLSDRGVCSVIRVCKPWNLAVESDEFWPLLFSKKGLPLVEGINKNYKQVFLNLYPRTINGKMIKKYFGEVRDIPLLAKEKYIMFVNQNDPFTSKEQKICRTFYLVINPAYVFRRYDKELFDLLDASNNKEDKLELSQDGKEMKIPFTLTNRKKLIEYPNYKIFACFHPEALLQCNSPSEKTTLWFMREEVVYRNHTYSDQKQRVEKKGFQLTPLSVRATFDAMKIRTEDTCPDKGAPNWTYASTSNTIQVGDHRLPMVIGGLVRTGVHVSSSNGDALKCRGALPGLSVEVQQSA